MSDVREKEKYYRRKPKSILISDCVYLDAERDRLVRELRKMEQEVEALHRQIGSLKVRSCSLRFSVAKLTEALISASDATLVDIK